MALTEDGQQTAEPSPAEGEQVAQMQGGVPLPKANGTAPQNNPSGGKSKPVPPLKGVSGGVNVPPNETPRPNVSVGKNVNVGTVTNEGAGARTKIGVVGR